MRKLLSLEFLRFLLVGGLNTAFSYGLYSLLLYIGLPYAAAYVGAVLLGILFSFRTQGRLVFGNRDARLLGRYAACWGLIWLANLALIALLVRIGFNAYAAGALALPPTVLVSYCVQRLFVFGPASPAGAAKLGRLPDRV